MNWCNYFVTVNGEVISYKLTKEKAINLAKEKYESTQYTMAVGIGRMKPNRNYTLLPLHFFL